MKDLISLGEQKKNSFQVELKFLSDQRSSLTPEDSKTLDSLKSKEKKVGFLFMELQDIKNNKGAVATL